MKKYTITTQAIIYQTFTVEAENKKEARHILLSGEVDEDEDSTDVDRVNVISIEEVSDEQVV